MTKPPDDDLPPPDLIDSRGRMRRLVLAFVLGVVAASIAYVVADNLAKPEQMPGGYDAGSRTRAFGFVFYTTGAAFAGVFALALVIQNAIEKRRYVRSLSLPTAKLRR